MIGKAGMTNMAAAMLLVFAAGAGKLFSGEAKPVTPAGEAAKSAYPISTITGWFADAKTGKPLPDIAVIASCEVDPYGKKGTTLELLPGEPVLNGAPSAKTDAKGCYRLQFMVPSPLRQAISVGLDPASKMRCISGGGGSEDGRQRIRLYQGESAGAEPLLLASVVKIQARVVDEEGKPVAGAQVCSTYRANHFRDFQSVDTDSNGAFCLNPNTVGGGARVCVAAPGYEWVDATVSAEEADPVIRLGKHCRPVEGRVIDSSGKSAAGVRVFAAPSIHMTPQWCVTTDGQGRFVMGTTPPGGVGMQIWPVIDGKKVGHAQPVKPGDKDVALAIFKIGCIETTVRDGEGRPVAAVPVWAMPLTEGLEARFCGATDEKGSFVAEGVPVGEYRVQIDTMKEKGQVAEPAQAIVEEGKTARVLLACRPAPEANQEVQKQESPVARGLLADAEGKPLLHAKVDLCLKRLGADGTERLHSASTITEADGRFEAALPYRDPKVQLFATRSPPPGSEPLAPEKPNQVRISVSLDMDVNRSVSPGLMGKEGQATAAAKNPGILPGPVIVFDLTRDWPENATSLDAGRLDTKLPAERLILLRMDRLASPARPFLGRPDVWVTGCMDAAGKPSPCRALHPRTPDESGFPVAVRCAGSCSVALENRYGDKTEVSLPEGAGDERTVAVAFPPLRRIEMTVLNRKGEPVRGMRWFADGQIGRTSSRYCIDTGKDGKIAFDMSSKATGRYRLLGFEDCLGYEPCSGEILAGKEPLVQTLRLEDSTAEVSGCLVDAKGQPVVGARLSLNVTIENVQGSVTLPVDEKGCYRTLLPGGSTVRIAASAGEKDGYLVGESEPIQVAAGQKVSVEVKLVDQKVFEAAKQKRQEAEHQARMREFIEGRNIRQAKPDEAKPGVCFQDPSPAGKKTATPALP